MGAASDALQTFERTLEELIVLLESEGAPAEALILATSRCVESFEGVRTHEGALTGASAEDLRRGRERVRQLHALARNATAAAVESTSLRVERTQDARRTLANLRAEASTGSACDLQG